MAKYRQLKTPGIYVEEVSAPAQVADVATAIPAFIGYTEKSPGRNAPIKISTLADFELHFGRPQPEKMHMKVRVVAGIPELTVPKINPKYTMHYQMQLFFANGGSACYVVSVGNFGRGKKSKIALLAGLKSLEKIDEITLIVFADVPAAGHISLNKAALLQAATLKDRFAILDIPDDVTDPIEDFRNNIGTENLSYGAAYYPKLISALVPYYTDETVFVSFARTKFHKKTLAEIAVLDAAMHTTILQKLQTALQNQPLVLYPSASIAGVYAQVDATGGVWKAPANVALRLVKSPEIIITNQMQDGLNVDAVAGKSINAIRFFAGKGVRVWGARTLAGNNNEWRYISVRRFCLQIQESVKKSLALFAFKPNDANTWRATKAMIENFLLAKWRVGAMVGTKPEEAFFVRVGINQTMTQQDIVEGSMIVEMGLSAVRPAEFIVVRLVQKVVVG